LFDECSFRALVIQWFHFLNQHALMFYNYKICFVTLINYNHISGSKLQQ
jgi:hypothetical protein